MRPSDDLFKLIQSLTASEKGYFRKQVTDESKKENNYLRLFDAIAKQKEYNESSIKKQFSKEVFVKQLNNTKLYLYQLILKHLREYHRQRSIKMRMRNLLDDAEILIQKGLYRQADKKVDSLQKLALRYENWIALIDGGDYTEAILNRTGSTKKGPTHWERTYTQREKHISILSENYKFRRLERKLILLNQKLGPTRNAAVLKEIDKFSKDPLLKSAKPPYSLDAQFRFNQIHAILALHRSDYKREAAFFYKNVELIEKNPALKEAYYKEYYPVALHNFINASLIADEFAAAEVAIQKLKKEQAVSVAQQARLFYYIIRDETYYWIRKGNAARGLSVKDEFERGLGQLSNAMNPDHVTTIRFNFAVLHLEMKEFQLSISYLENALESRHQAAFENIQAFARILLIINHYELKNFQLLPHLLSTTEFFLKKKQALFGYEKAILQFFKKLAANLSRAEVRKEALILKQKLKTLYENPLEKNAALVFDFSGWLEKLILRFN